MAPNQREDSFHSSSTPPDAAELAYLDFLLRCEQGESPDFDALCEEHPESAGKLKELHADQRWVTAFFGSLPSPDGGSTPSATVSTAPRGGGGAGFGALPERIASYRIVGLLGQGGMGIVYRAEQENPTRDVALKVVRPGALSASALRRFRHETEALGRLQHPGIAQIFEAGTHETEAGPRPFFAMELVEGTPLGRYAQETPLELEQRLRLLVAVCRALDHAHRKGVIHRDLKPANILVTPSGMPKVVDFGLARITAADLDLTSVGTRAGGLLGTVKYMSPEQIEDPTTLGARSDVYSLGVIGFELLTGQLPHDLHGRSMLAAARRVLEEPARRLSSLMAHVDPALDAILARALHSKVDARYPSAAAFAADLEHFLDGGSVRATSEHGDQGAGLRALVVHAACDEIHKNRLVTQLEPLARDGTLASPLPTLAVAEGADWPSELSRRLERAQLVIVLVTAELPAADLERLLTGVREHATAVLVRVEEGALRAFLDEQGARGLTVLPASGQSVLARPLRNAWTELAQELRGLLANFEARTSALPTPRPSDPTLRGDLRDLLEIIPGSTQDFVGRERELEELDGAYASQRVALYGLIAFGGVGKTSLVHRWLSQRFVRAPDVLFLGWSFHSQGTREQAGTSDPFLASALDALGDPAPESGSLWARGRRLAELVAERSAVVVLDGIEPLQYEPGTDLAGQLKDHGLRGFLGELTRAPGKAFVLVTSRVMLAQEDLESAAVELRQLRVLAASAARTLLRRRGLRGEDSDLDRAAKHLGFHPLALVLAAEYQLTFGDGSAHSIPEIPLLRPELELGRQAMSILAAYEQSLVDEGEPLDGELLRVMGLFDRAVQLEWLDALRQPPAIPGLTDALIAADEQALWESISRLRQWGLMLGGVLAGTSFLDTHPLIREYFGDKLRATDERAWSSAHQRLFEHLAATSEPFPDTLRTMEPLMLAVVHGCKAGMPATALRDVYFPRIQRGAEGFATNELGAGSAALATLAHCFDRGRWGVFPAENERQQAPLSREERLEVLSEAAQHLAAVRSYSSPDAERCYALAREMCVELGDSPRLLRVLFGLWLSQMFRGQAREALGLSHRILETAESIAAPPLLPAAHRAISSTHFYRGEYAAALEHAELGLTHADSRTVPAEQRHLTHEPVVSCLTYRGMSLWHLSRTAPQRARALWHCDRATERALRQGLAHSQAVALFLTTVAHQWEGDARDTLARAEQTTRVSGEKGFPIWRKGGEMLGAWARARLGQDADASATVIRRIVENWGSSGEALLKPYWLMLLADVHCMRGHTREAVPLLEEARALADETGEHWCDAEIGRMAGANLGPSSHGRRWLEEAREIALRQGSVRVLERIEETAT